MFYQTCIHTNTHTCVFISGGYRHTHKCFNLCILEHISRQMYNIFEIIIIFLKGNCILKWQDHSKLAFYYNTLGWVVKNLPANAEDMCSVRGLRRSLGEGNGNSLQHSCLGNAVDRGGGCYSPWDCKRVGHDLVIKQQQQLFFNLLNFDAIHALPTWKIG